MHHVQKTPYTDFLPCIPSSHPHCRSMRGWRQPPPHPPTVASGRRPPTSIIYRQMGLYSSKSVYREIGNSQWSVASTPGVKYLTSFPVQCNGLSLFWLGPRVYVRVCMYVVVGGEKLGSIQKEREQLWTSQLPPRPTGGYKVL